MNAHPLLLLQINYWYKQEFSPTWSGTYQPALVQIRAKYNAWFGSSPNGLRSGLNKWVTSCDQSCSELTASLIADGKAKLTACEEKVAQDGKPNWRNLNGFANAYLQMATKLFMFSSTSLVLFHQYSFCDPDKYDAETVLLKCKWNAAIENLMTKVFAVQSRALFLRKIMETASTECGSSRFWPLSQTCSKSSCNYKWALAISNNDWDRHLGSLDEQGKFVRLDESFYQSDSERTCQNDYDKWHQSLGFGYGGLYGYTSEAYSDPSYVWALREGNCAEITNWANNQLVTAKITFGAIPNFCINPDLPKCVALLGLDDLWGTNVEVSSEPLVQYPANLRCKNLEADRFFVSNGKDECWEKCKQKIQPIFFFTVEGANQCRCYETW